MTENTDTNAYFAAEEIVAAEYEYIAQTAFQAQEDRARVTSFYIVSLGSLFGAFFSTNGGDEEVTMLAYAGFAALFFFLSYFGFITIKQLIMLRKAWFESAKAMNQIKDFLISKNNDLNAAFRWQSKTLPPTYKPGNVAYLLAQQVALLGAITTGAGIFYAGKALENSLLINPILSISLAFIAGFIFLRYQMSFYRKKLEN